MFEQIRYYFVSSHRRKLIDGHLKRYSWIFTGTVLDIGGRDRGKFKKPKDKVTRWIFADINPAHNPDIILDVARMDAIGSESVNTICACELFEHVEQIEKGLDECSRVLKIGGRLLISIPFLYPIHADPDDFQRWTETKWRNELTKRNFQIEIFSITGRYFTVLADQIKLFMRAMPRPIRWILYLFLPLLDGLVFLDESRVVSQSSHLRNAHGGYFIVVVKL